MHLAESTTEDLQNKKAIKARPALNACSSEFAAGRANAFNIIQHNLADLHWDLDGLRKIHSAERRAVAAKMVRFLLPEYTHSPNIDSFPEAEKRQCPDARSPQAEAPVPGYSHA